MPKLGLTIIEGGPDAERSAPAPVDVNTRNALWPDRWPAIAKTTCIEIVEAAPIRERAQAKYDLPCSTCELSSSCLNGRRKELGALLYDREILTNPRSSESSLFPRELMEPMFDRQLAMQQTYRKPYGKENQFAVVQAWDLAWSEKTGGDYLVCMTGAVDLRGGVVTLVGLERWQRLSFDQQCRLIELKWAQYRAQMVVIEADAAQSIWSQHMARTTPVPVVPHTSSGKRDLAHGVPSMLIQFQNQKWRIPRRPGSWGQSEVDNLLAELESFGWADGKLEGVGEHDDTVMAMWHLSWGIRNVLLGPLPTRGSAPRSDGRYN